MFILLTGQTQYYGAFSITHDYIAKSIRIKKREGIGIIPHKYDFSLTMGLRLR